MLGTYLVNCNAYIIISNAICFIMKLIWDEFDNELTWDIVNDEVNMGCVIMKLTWDMFNNEVTMGCV